jgi:EAL domain
MVRIGVTSTLTFSAFALRLVSQSRWSVTNRSNACVPLMRPRVGWCSSGSPANDRISAPVSPLSSPSKYATAASRSRRAFSMVCAAAGAVNSSGIQGMMRCGSFSRSSHEVVSRLVAEGTAVVDALRALGALGVKVDLDDFGARYAAFSLLAEMPIDAIKIDRRFTAEVTRDALLVGVARELSIAVIAEGDGGAAGGGAGHRLHDRAGASVCPRFARRGGGPSGSSFAACHSAKAARMNRSPERR